MLVFSLIEYVGIDNDETKKDDNNFKYGILYVPMFLFIEVNN